MVIVPDPGVQHGHYHVYQRTDLAWIVYDERLPLGHKTVSVHRLFADADREAMRLSKIDTGP